MFVYFVRAHVCLSVSVDVSLHFQVGFWEGHGFESVS